MDLFAHLHQLRAFDCRRVRAVMAPHYCRVSCLDASHTSGVCRVEERETEGRGGGSVCRRMLKGRGDLREQVGWHAAPPSPMTLAVAPNYMQSKYHIRTA
jgi:hypothetical protein